MKKLSLAILLLAGIALSASAQSVPPTKWCESDGAPCVTPPTKVIVPSGTISGKTVTITSGGGSGTVTSVAQTFTGGLISVGGSPVTTSGTLALTVAGTSGGIPYFSSGSTWASSAALTANALMIGGGAGAAPSTTTTGTGVVAALGVNVGTAGAFVVNGGALGTPSSGTLTNATGLPIATGVSGLGTGVATALAVNVGSAGAFVTFNGAGGTPSSLTLTNATGLPPTTGISGWPANASGVLTNNGSGTLSWAAAGGGITIGTTTITSGTTGRVLYDNAGVVGEMTTSGTGTQLALTAGPTFTGTVAGAAFTASSTITQTSSSATAFESGPNGGTNPVLRLVNNVASAATGLSITGNAAAAGADITVLSSGSNENLNLLAKGTGRVNIATVGGLSGTLRVIGATASTNYFEIGSSDASTSYLTSSNGNFQLQGNSQFMMLGNRLIKFYNGGFNAALGSDTSGLIEINSGTLGAWRDLKVRQHYVDQTITAGGTTGNQTINKAAGTVNLAASATSLTVTSSLVSTSSTVYAMARTNDTTCSVKNVVPGSGSFTINMTAACTAETSVGFLIVNF